MKSIRVTKTHFEYVVFITFITAGILGVARAVLSQDIVWVSDGLGWDGVHYNRLMEFFSQSGLTDQRAVFPFCGRIGTPWLLVSVFQERIGFLEFNLVISVLFSGLFLAVTHPLWGGCVKAIAAAIAIPSFLYFSPIKFTNFYPAYMDPPFMLILTVALFFVIRKQYQGAAFVCIAAIPFREAAFYVIPLLSAFAVAVSDNKIRAAAISIFALILGYLVVQYMLQIAECQAQSQIKTAFFWLYKLLTEPTRFIAAIAAISLTLGPLLFLRKQGEKEYQISEVEVFSIIAIVYFALLSVVGGSDVTRIFYTFVPLYAPVIILAFARMDLSGFLLACLGWILTNQFINKYAQPISEWPDNDLTGFFAQFPDHAHPVVGLAILATWFCIRASYSFVLPFEKFIFRSD